MIRQSIQTFLLSSILIAGNHIGLYAQQSGEFPVFTQNHEEDIIMITVAVGLFVAMMAVGILVWQLLRGVDDLRRELRVAKGLEVKEQEDLISVISKKISKALTDAVPVEREQEVDMGHNYDGIRELDNNLPPWWKYLFYASIVWSGVYLVHFHVLGNGALSHEEYQAEMEAAAKEKEAYLKLMADQVDETNVTVLDDNASMSKGQKVFNTLCQPCHGAFGEGSVGPNLTDIYWIHGGEVQDIFKTIKYGVPEKGMISWQAQMTAREMQEVASYIVSLRGSNPPNPKAPQGDAVVYEAVEETGAGSSADSLQAAVSDTLAVE